MTYMRNTMKLIPFLSHSNTLEHSKLTSSSQWLFPSCANINTLSFSNSYSKDITFTTFNSAYYLDTTNTCESFSTMSDDNNQDTECDPIESVIRGLRSDRLFFEPEPSCSLVKNPHPNTNNPISCCSSSVVYKESEALSLDSNNPCEDFRRSMEEMVEAHELKDWQGLEELLECYLKINDKTNHGYIIGAFIDLLVNISFISSTTTTTTTTTTSTSLTSSTNLNCSSPSSPLSLPSSSLTTPCLSSLLDHDNDDTNDDHDSHDIDHKCSS